MCTADPVISTFETAHYCSHLDFVDFSAKYKSLFLLTKIYFKEVWLNIFYIRKTIIEKNKSDDTEAVHYVSFLKS